MNERVCVALVGRTCKGDKSRHQCSFTNEGTTELNCGFEAHGLTLVGLPPRSFGVIILPSINSLI
jgi:hypothetical protein